MKIKNIFILLYFFANTYCYGQSANFEKEDSLVVIKGDTAIYDVFGSSKINGIFMLPGVLFENNKEYAFYSVFQKENNKRHGIDMVYNDKYQIRSCRYVQYESPEKCDTLLNGDIECLKSLCNEGIIVDGSLYENRIIGFTVVGSDNKNKTTFILDNHSRISKRLYYNNKEKPIRIIFFTKKMKIKGDFQIEEIDIKKDYLKYKYWKHK